MYGRNVMSTSLLEVSLLGVGTVLRLERDAWSMVKRLRQATNEYAPPLHPQVFFLYSKVLVTLLRSKHHHLPSWYFTEWSRDPLIIGNLVCTLTHTCFALYNMTSYSYHVSRTNSANSDGTSNISVLRVRACFPWLAT